LKKKLSLRELPKLHGRGWFFLNTTCPGSPTRGQSRPWEKSGPATLDYPEGPSGSGDYEKKPFSLYARLPKVLAESNFGTT